MNNNSNYKKTIQVTTIDKKEIRDSKGVPFNCYYVHTKDGEIFTAYENTYGFSNLRPKAELEIEYYTRERNNFVYKNLVKIAPHYSQDDILKPSTTPEPKTTQTTSNYTYVRNIPTPQDKSYMNKTLEQLTPEEQKWALIELLKSLILALNKDAVIPSYIKKEDNTNLPF